LTVTNDTGGFGTDSARVKVQPYSATNTHTGACCSADGTCQVIAAAACADQGGTYQGDNTTCDPNPCAGRVGCGGGVCGTGVAGVIPLTLLALCGLKYGYGHRRGRRVQLRAVGAGCSDLTGLKP
jgi:hypothetical protein